jgi:hypothetical protein
MTEAEDPTDANLWGFLGDIFEELMATDWSGAQVLVVMFCLLLPVIVYCFMKFIQVKYSRNTKGGS